MIDPPLWPAYLDLKRGVERTVARPTPQGLLTRTLVLRAVEERYEPDYWIADNAAHQTLAEARVTLEVSGEPVVLLARPYQMPVTANGLRLYVEATRNWANLPQYTPLAPLEGEVRIACCAENESWGPPELRFPIEGFRWRGTSYSNTWASLVPYNRYYYHRGEDYGAINDHLPVVAMADAEVLRSPLPHGDGQSNRLDLTLPGGMAYYVGHMNTESLEAAAVTGARLAAGQRLGLTGCTWGGHRAQHLDPHVHFEFYHPGGDPISAYPTLVEAYLRTYPDPVLPNAGGYYFSVPGREVVLDGSRTVVRPGRRIVDCWWQLHHGGRQSGRQAPLTYAAPGLYSEAFHVRLEDGTEDCDFAQVRVYDPARGRDMAWGWVLAHPVRDVRPGMPVVFWNRLLNLKAPVKIDYGDGAPVAEMGAESQHAYAAPGLYTVRVTSTGPEAETVQVQVRVVVEPSRA